jgi:hypothetical protein
MGKLVKFRSLTIQEKTRNRKYNERTFYPTLRIEGNWLKQAGFNSFETVILTVEQGKIVISKKPQNQRA